MNTEPPKYCDPVQCNHCGNRSAMLIGAQFHDDCDCGDYGYGYVYDLLKCPACEGVVLQRTFWHSQMHPDDSPPRELVYPVAGAVPAGLPQSIERGFEAARRVKAIDANAFAVLLGRVMDLVCSDQNASGKVLADRLNDLARRSIIPERLAKVASGLRDLRNIGGHADLGELTPQDVPLLEDLTKAVLEYVYSAPKLLLLAEQRLAQLKAAAK